SRPVAVNRAPLDPPYGINRRQTSPIRPWRRGIVTDRDAIPKKCPAAGGWLYYKDRPESRTILVPRGTSRARGANRRAPALLDRVGRACMWRRSRPRAASGGGSGSGFGSGGGEGDGVSVLDGAALIFGAAIASVHIRAVIRGGDPLAAPGWLLIW